MRASATSHLAPAQASHQPAQAANANQPKEASPFDQLIAAAAPEKTPAQKETAQKEIPAEKPANDKAAVPAQTVPAESAAVPPQPKPVMAELQDIAEELPAPADETAPAADAQAGEPALIAQPVPQQVAQPVTQPVAVTLAMPPAANDEGVEAEAGTAPISETMPADATQQIAAAPQDGAAQQQQTATAAPQDKAAPQDSAAPPQEIPAGKTAPQPAAEKTVPDAAEPVREQREQVVDAGNADDIQTDAAKPGPAQAAGAEPAAAKAAPPATPATNMAMPVPAQPHQASTSAAAPQTPAHVEVSAEAAKPNLPALAVEISARSLSGARQFDIRLDPPELGRVEVRLSIDAAGKASAHLSADLPQTLDLLQKDSSSLTRALREAGLNVAQDALNFSLRQQAHDGSAQHHGRGPARGLALTATHSIEATPAAAPSRANGRLDIRV